MAKALLAFYVTAVLALLAAAWSIFHLRCESFGCMGIGVAWFAWVVSFFVVLGLGLFARGKVASSAGLARICKTAFWLQLMAGAALVAVWAAKTLA